MRAAVLVLQQLFWPGRLRILDFIVIQRPLHRSPSPRHWCFRSIRFRSGPGPISAAVHSRSTKHILYEDRVLAVDHQRVLSQYRTYSPIFWPTWLTDVVRSCSPSQSFCSGVTSSRRLGMTRDTGSGVQCYISLSSSLCSARQH